MCGGLMDSDGRAKPEDLGLVVVKNKNGSVMIIDSRHTEESLREVMEKASKGLGPPVNETVWLIPKEEVIPA